MTIEKIAVIHNVDQQTLHEKKVASWNIWEKEVSVFPWTYDMNEVCYFLAGEVIVTPEGGEPVCMGKGDMASFPKGMTCTWDIRKNVKKHYRFF